MNKTALITGASSGLGKDFATLFAEKGYDLVLTARRRKNLEEIISSMGMIAEGVNTTKVVHELSNKLNIEMPISNSVYDVLFMRKNPRTSVKNLMIRKLKKERLQE